MKKYKMAQLCEHELQRLKSCNKPDEEVALRQTQAQAVAAAVEAAPRLSFTVLPPELVVADFATA